MKFMVLEVCYGDLGKHANVANSLVGVVFGEHLGADFAYSLAAVGTI